VQIHIADANRRSKSVSRSGGQHRVPNLWCRSTLCAELPKFELTIPDAMRKLDARDRN
jgi:hypothetical protein